MTRAVKSTCFTGRLELPDRRSLCNPAPASGPREAYRCLVALPVFKTGEVEYLGLAGSIPVRLRRPGARRVSVASRADPRQEQS